VEAQMALSMCNGTLDIVRPLLAILHSWFIRLLFRWGFKKENIEYSSKTRCFPEGRKIFPCELLFLSARQLLNFNQKTSKSYTQVNFSSTILILSIFIRFTIKKVSIFLHFFACFRAFISGKFLAHQQFAGLYPAFYKLFTELRRASVVLKITIEILTVGY
jgi:hypothetical protein